LVEIVGDKPRQPASRVSCALAQISWLLCKRMANESNRPTDYG